MKSKETLSEIYLVFIENFGLTELTNHRNLCILEATPLRNCILYTWEYYLD